MERHTLRSGTTTASVHIRGAELQALSLNGHEVLWNGRPLWPKHAPLLFPVVGSLRDGGFRLGGKGWTLPRHGFARDRTWTWTYRGPSQCRLVLVDDADTRSAYPFPFRLEVRHALTGDGYHLEGSLTNTGRDPLPASLGLHPAFRWPLAPGIPKEAHRLVFEGAAPADLHRLTAEGLLDPRPVPSPIRDGMLPLDPGLFATDALVFLQGGSGRVRYESEGGPTLVLHWEGFPHLGLWARPEPGPAFLCVEPWDGYADPDGWTGEFTSKPGSFLLAPGASRHWRFQVVLA